MTGHLLWNMTRPTRRLRTIIEAMPVFKKVAENKEWTREIQAEFEEGLAKASVKTDGDTRKDSGGKRTWAVYPKIFGLWYEDNSKKVKITQAGEKVVAGGSEAVKQIRHQVLRFQWPNRTQEHKSQQMDDGFRIFPYRFIIKLLLDEKIKYLLTSEIALFILQVKTENEFEDVVKKILRYRGMYQGDKIPLNKRKSLIEEHKKLRPEMTSGSYGITEHFKYVTDLANTFMNHLEFFNEVIHDKNSTHNENQIRLEPDSKRKMTEIIEDYDKRFPLSSLTKYGVKWFVENYGNSYDRQKASRKTTKPKTKTEKDLELIKHTIMEILGENISLSNDELVTKISELTGMGKDKIKTIITQNPQVFDFYKSGNNQFAQKYLEVAPDGNKHEEFEEMTRKIFRSFDFPIEKISIPTETGNKLIVDGFVQNNISSGIIDAKSGKKFSCGNKEVGIMKDYINRFRIYVHNGTSYNLEFFAYVYGKKFDNKRNFKRIIEETGISGAVISASEMLKLKEKYEQGKISQRAVWELFKKNKEITSFDY